ncbi:hypothetical protein HMPREF0091_10312 [Fannyhessea vaginae DSM 15829]|uniref:Uncharacterized protein n=1 Tax=Fannyhessea vaginae DSM 15829 TaxID=525256 RepID=F1T3S1_9ACTN|nr:hypothetical protein HMPREF0091_10312 [Fannyhessea vaginae DSM 15829]
MLVICLGARATSEKIYRVTIFKITIFKMVTIVPTTEIANIILMYKL